MFSCFWTFWKYGINLYWYGILSNWMNALKEIKRLKTSKNRQKMIGHCTLSSFHAHISYLQKMVSEISKLFLQSTLKIKRGSEFVIVTLNFTCKFLLLNSFCELALIFALFFILIALVSVCFGHTRMMPFANNKYCNINCWFPPPLTHTHTLFLYFCLFLTYYPYVTYKKYIKLDMFFRNKIKPLC